MKHAGPGDRLGKALEATLKRVTASRRTMPLSIRMTEAEHALLDREAKRRGVPKATLAKSIILTTLGELAEDTTKK